AYFSQHLVRGPRAFGESDPNGLVPETLRRLILKTLSKDRSLRFATADEMREAVLAESRALAPLLAVPEAEAETAAVLKAVHPRGVGRRGAAKASAALDMPPVHVDEPRSVPPAPRPRVEVRSAPPDLRAAPSAERAVRGPGRALALAAAVL